MIEVNLLPSSKKKSSGGAGVGINMDQVKAMLAKVKDPLLLTAAGSWAVAVLICGFFWVTDNQRLATQEEELARVQSEQKRFSALIKQKRQAEMLRDSLLIELNVIRGIDGERFVWPHVFEEVTRALPDFTWLVGLEPMGVSKNPAPGTPPAAGQQPADSGEAEQTVKFTVEGRTSDIQAYTRFLRQLANSPWISDIVAGPTTTAIEENRPVTAFSLTARYHRADSSFIRTAPLIQTLR